MSLLRAVAAFGAALTLSLAGSAARATVFVYDHGSFTYLDVPGVYLTGDFINNSGTVAGLYVTNRLAGYVETGGAYTPIDQPGSRYTTVSGLNNVGDVIGLYVTNPYTEHPFVRAASGAITLISFPGSSYTTLGDLNDSGTVVGSYWNGFRYQGFVDSGGAYSTVSIGPGSTSLSNINNVGDLLGNYAGQYFLKTSGGVQFITPPAGWGSMTIEDFNDSNVLAGTYSNGLRSLGFFGVNGHFTTIDPFGWGDVQVTGINNKGELSGYVSNGFGTDIGFIYSGDAYTFLKYWHFITDITDINDDGVVVGSSYQGTFVPEPGVWTMLLVGAFALGGASRRRRALAPDAQT